MSIERRRQAVQRGRGSERLVALWLRLKGYRILERGFRASVGEIDLIARRGNVLAVIEVKSRRTVAEASVALSSRQRRRISRATLAYLQRHPSLAQLSVRFDVVLLSASRPPCHIRDAWRENPPL